jgi:hypothetical protein
MLTQIAGETTFWAMSYPVKSLTWAKKFMGLKRETELPPRFALAARSAAIAAKGL